MAKVTTVNNHFSSYYWVFRSVAAGIVIGVLAWGLSVVLDKLFFTGALCDGTANCIEARSAAGVLASALAAVVGAILLALLRIPRALFIAIASLFITWKIQGYLWGLWWFEALLWSALVNALVYVLFAIIAHIQRWALVVVASLLVVIGVQIVLMLY